MLDRLLPPRADNAFRGQGLALVVFGLLALMKLAMSLNSIFNPHGVAGTADGVPLEAFPPAASRTILALVTSWGLAQLVVALLCVVALVRYRALVPLLFALQLLEQLGRWLARLLAPSSGTGAPAARIVPLVLLGLSAAGLVLSLWERKGARPSA